MYDSVPLFHTPLVDREQPQTGFQRRHTLEYTRLWKPSCLRHHCEACYHRAYRASSQFRGGENAFRTFSRAERNVLYFPLSTIDSGPRHRGTNSVDVHIENIGIFVVRINPILGSNCKTPTP